jgi:7-cyano-7-deazaguanine synthase
LSQTVDNIANEKAVVIFSGGQDSTTCLAQAVNDYGRGGVACITFSYGQRHSREVEVARSIATDFGVTPAQHHIVDLNWYGELTTSALLDNTLTISQEPTAVCPNTVVDGRNMLFLLIAAIYAKNRNISELIIGVCQADFSGYPDCRDIFVKSCNVTLNLAMDFDFRVEAPLMNLTKADIWGVADRLGVLEYIAEKTLTCYNGIIGAGCGTCPSCKLRQRGLATYLEWRGGQC